MVVALRRLSHRHRLHRTASVLGVLVCLGLFDCSPVEARTYPCWLVRWYVNNHTREEVEEAARKHRATAKERAAAVACLKEKK